MIAGIHSRQILDSGSLSQLSHLKNQAYILPLNELSDFQFMSLMALADIPVLVEGDTSVSHAIQLRKEFLVYRSDWNTQQIRSVMELDTEQGRFLYSDVYFLPEPLDGSKYSTHYYSSQFPQFHFYFLQKNRCLQNRVQRP